MSLSLSNGRDDQARIQPDLRRFKAIIVQSLARFVNSTHEESHQLELLAQALVPVSGETALSRLSGKGLP
jgi:hypothetical protein